MPATLPNFLIIGAQKSGTSSLAHYLEAHPEVHMVPRKEVRYFDLNYDKGIQWYMEQFVGSKKEQRAVGEASPTYMCLEEMPERMAAAVPAARLIAILRDPVDRAYSHYWHNRSRDRESLTFVDALAAEPERMDSRAPDSARGTTTGDGWMERHHYDPVARRYLHHPYLARGRYLEQLQRVCQYYPRESLQVLLFEDLVKAPLETFQRACRFLKIDDTFTPPNLGATINSYALVRSRRLRRISASLRARRMYLLSGAINRINVSNSYPPMDPALRAELQRRFAEDNSALAAWLGRDLSRWNPQLTGAT